MYKKYATFINWTSLYPTSMEQISSWEYVIICKSWLFSQNDFHLNQHKFDHGTCVHTSRSCFVACKGAPICVSRCRLKYLFSFGRLAYIFFFVCYFEAVHCCNNTSSSVQSQKTVSAYSDTAFWLCSICLLYNLSRYCLLALHSRAVDKINK